jgi:pimeloyl-ACP methyl ester carboxylesterase
MEVRAHLRAHRHRLAVEAAGHYPDVPKLAGTPLLTRPEWVPAQPVPLADIAIDLVADSPRFGLPASDYARTMAALDAPTVFENRPTYRLLAASLTAEPTLRFGPGHYFDSIDTGEASAHEYAAAELTGAPTPLRDAIGDPTVLAARPVNLAISALTVRRDRFLLHWRDPAKVGHAGGLYQVVPVGVFQGEPFSLWRFLLREYAEELLGEPERETVDPAFEAAMTSALAAGRIRARCHGMGVDPLTFATDLLVSVHLDDHVFEELFGRRVAVNDEGTVSEHPLARETIAGLPMQAAGEALVNLTVNDGVRSTRYSTREAGMPTTHTMSTAEVDLTYDLHGPLPTADGRPLLFMIGQPMDASGFTTLASYFADRTVVTYDPRGLGRSVRKDGRDDHVPEVQAGDVHALIQSLDAGPVEMFASSGGAVTALALVAAHPDDVITLVAHEPPLIPVLPDAAAAERARAGVRDAYEAKGFGAGMAAFMRLTSWQGEFTEDYFAQPTPDPAMFGLPTEDDGKRDDPLLSGRTAAVTGYRMDVEALTNSTTRVVIAVGEESRDTMPGRTAIAAAKLLGQEATVFPSHHGGFLGPEFGYEGQPAAFAEKLRTVLGG